jgi:hypothetical protein
MAINWDAQSDGSFRVEVRNGAIVIQPDMGGLNWLVTVDTNLRDQWSEISTWLTLDAARDDAEDYIVHLDEISKLGRNPVDDFLPKTPWGKANRAFCYGEEILRYHAQLGSGFHLGEKAQRRLNKLLRIESGWYSDRADDWIRIAIGLPDRFTQRENRYARQFLERRMPEVWRRLHAEDVVPGYRLDGGESPVFGR